MATTDGTITSFTATPQSNLQIGGVSYNVQTAGRSYSLTEPDSQTLRFEIRPDDRAWYDGTTVDRALVASSQKIPAATPVNVSYQFMVEPGAANTSSWFVTGEMHNDDSVNGSATSPPLAIQLAGEHLQVVARYCPTGQNASNAAGNVKTMVLWTDPNPIQRGQYYNIQLQGS